MSTSRILRTVDYPIPTWKGPLENNVPAILTISADSPAISGSDTTVIDCHCPDVFDPNTSIISDI